MATTGEGLMQESISATKSEEIVNDFDVKISSEVLFVDGTERKSAVITVSGNKQKPVFEVSNDEVVALEDYVEVDEATGVGR